MFKLGDLVAFKADPSMIYEIGYVSNIDYDLWNENQYWLCVAEADLMKVTQTIDSLYSP